jgi:hypothetical protein
MREHKQRVQELVREGVNRLHTQLLSGLKEVVEQAIALQAEWEKRLAEPIVGSLSPDEGEMTSPSVPVILGQEEEVASPTVTGADSEYKCDILEQLQQTWMDTEVAVPEGPPLATPLESARQPDKGNMDRVAATSGGREPPKTYEGKVELEILPPLVPSQLVEIQNYLRDWPGIGITELRPNNKGYLITVILDKPIQLVDILKQLPEVKDAREHSAEALVGGARSKDSLRRIAITVSGHK